MVADEGRGAGRPPVEAESKKVPYSVSIRRSGAAAIERILEMTGETRPELFERMIDEEECRVRNIIGAGRDRIVEWLQSHRLGAVQIHRLEGTAYRLVTGSLTILATESALYRIGANDDELTSPEIGRALYQMLHWQTKEARLDIINGRLDFGTPEAVAHSLRRLTNQYVRMWVIGQDEPYVGKLTDFGDAVQLGATLGAPPGRNGTGLIQKANVLQVEALN